MLLIGSTKRVAVYEATRTLLATVFHGTISEDDLRDYGLKTLDAQCLFDDDLHKFLGDVRNRVAAWIDADLRAGGEPVGEEKSAHLRLRSKHLTWITEQGDQRLPLRFMPFLLYAPAKHPWFLRWLRKLDA
jgi:hypothetical protein